MLKNLGIKAKLAILVTSAIIIVLITVTGVCFLNFQKELKRIVQADQETRIQVFWDLLRKKGSEFRIENDRLMVGDYVISNNHELPDKVQELCGGTATIFMRDERVATNVRKGDGTRAVGTTLDGVAYDAVFGGHRSYRGEADILGVPYFTAYDPIRDRNGAIIGVLYTGIARSEFFQRYDRLKTQVALIALLFVAVICGLLNMIISRMITRPLTRVAGTIKGMEYDLTRRLRLTGKDEIGSIARWFNTFVGSMDQIISRAKSITRNVDHATQEVAEGGQGLSQATQEQAAAIEQVAATIEEMTASIKNNALNADKGREMARVMVNMASTSGDASQRLMEAMDEISVASRRVGDIIATVNEVAFQTNLLALNAAVEAARAGEHGKGFAVVAEEVRALAQRSAEAANEIKGLIEDTVQKVNAGDEIVRSSVESLNQIIANIHDLSRNMDEIAVASGEQATGVDEVNRALSQIDSTTQQNASIVEELAMSSDDLRSEAGQLADLVEQFRVSDMSGTGPSGRKLQGKGISLRSERGDSPARVSPGMRKGRGADMDEGFEEF